MKEAIGDRFHAVLIDTGLMRLDECQQVKETLAQHLGINLTVVDASERFLSGLKGVEEGYDLPPEATNNIYEMTPEERAAEGIGSLPQNLAEAVTAMEESELVAEALGEHVFEYFIRNKRSEWMDYKSHVTPWELDRYLGSL